MEKITQVSDFKRSEEFAGTQENGKMDLSVSTETDSCGFKKEIDLQKDNRVLYIIIKKTGELGSEAAPKISQTTGQNLCHLLPTMPSAAPVHAAPSPLGGAQSHSHHPPFSQAWLPILGPGEFFELL